MPPETSTAPAPTTQAAAAATAQAPAPSTPAPAAKPAAPSSPFDTLDSKVKAAPPKPPEKPAEVTTDDTSVAKPGEAAKPATPPDNKADRTVEHPRVLRQKLETVSKERDTHAGKARDLEAKIAELEKTGGDTKALTEKLSTMEKNHALLQERLAAVDYQASDEFKSKFVQPFTDAAERAKSVVEQLTVTAEDGTERSGTWDDFSVLYQLPYGKASKEAVRLFGPENASIIMRHYDSLKNMALDRQKAVDNHAATAGERESRARAEQVQKAEKVNQAWKTTNDNIVENNPEWFGENPEDPEGNAILKESATLVDQAYTGRDKMNDEQRIVLDAHIRNRAIAFPRMARKASLLEAKVAELEGRLADKAGSLPGGTKKPTGGAGTSPDMSLEDDLKKSGIFG